MLRTIGVRRGLEFGQLTKAEERIDYDIPSGEALAKRHVVKGNEGPCMPAIETEAITIATPLRRDSRMAKAQ